jgi:arabinan endo-1,5-alpha-L-arabinosidase
VWTLPADADVRVGLMSHGGAGATSRFDYLRLYAD